MCSAATFHSLETNGSSPDASGDKGRRLTWPVSSSLLGHLAAGLLIVFGMRSEPVPQGEQAGRAGVVPIAMLLAMPGDASAQAAGDADPLQEMQRAETIPLVSEAQMPTPSAQPDAFLPAPPIEIAPSPMMPSTMAAPSPEAATSPPIEMQATASQVPAVMPVVEPPPPIRAEAPPATPVSPAAPRPAPQRPAPATRARATSQGTSPSVAAAAASGSATSTTEGPVAPVAAAAGPPLVTSPRFRRRPSPPDYPPRAIELDITGTVVVRALLDPEGDPREVRVHRSSGHSILDAAALAAVRRWAFEPATRDGRKIDSLVEVPVHFRLN